MKKIIIGILIFLFLAGIGLWWWQKNSYKPQSFTGGAMEALAKESIVLEILKGQAEINLSGVSKTFNAPLSQEIEKGAKITTLEESQAQIIFPTGSVARLDSNTTIDLEEFLDESQQTDIKIKLDSGNLWSRVQRLIDKETSYEVQTSNTVAVVKGTSFNISFQEGQTKLAVLSNAVQLKVLDPQTKQVLTGGEAEVAAGQEIETDLVSPPTPEKPLLPKPLPTEKMEQPWFKNNFDQDKKIEEKVIQVAGSSKPDQKIVKEKVLEQVVNLKQEKTLTKEAIKEEPKSGLKKIIQMLPGAKPEDKPAMTPNSNLLKPKESPPPTFLPPKPVVSPDLNLKSSQSPQPSILAKPSPSPKPPITTVSPSAKQIIATPAVSPLANLQKISISSVTPNSAPGNGYQYTRLTVKGAGFASPAKIFIGSHLLNNIKFIDSNTLEGTLGAGISPGQYDVVVIVGDQKAVLAKGFSVYQPR